MHCVVFKICCNNKIKLDHAPPVLARAAAVLILAKIRLHCRRLDKRGQDSIQD